MSKRGMLLIGMMFTLLAPMGTQAAIASQDTDSSDAGVVAKYEGRLINLAESWEGAQYCGVYSADDVRCFSTTANMIEYEGGDSDGGVSTEDLSDCPSGPFTNEWYCLFEHSNHQGRMLKFKDTGCQSLADFGFANQTSSWANTLGQDAKTYDTTTCGTLLWTAPGHSNSTFVGSTNNDRASSIDIQP
ncbi:MAG: peptidase inhibitor family I36 protein [Vicinamibacteraceae bacterium]